MELRPSLAAFVRHFARSSHGKIRPQAALTGVWSGGLFLLATALPQVASAQNKMLGPTKEQLTTICGGREGCQLLRAAVPGRAEGGAYLMVTEIRFAKTAAMITDPSLACRPMENDAEPNGGYEFWLMKGEGAPQKILSLCNDGYGAAGTGEDSVTIRNGRLVLTQHGGSAWQWDIVKVIELDPLRKVSEEQCDYYHDPANLSGVAKRTDLKTMQTRSAAFAGDASSRDGVNEAACPPLDETPLPLPRENVAYGQNVLAPLYDPDDDKAQLLPEGTGLGNCATMLASNGQDGFRSFSENETDGKGLRVKAIAETHSSLIVQIDDPLEAAFDGEIPRGHPAFIEIWTQSERQFASNQPLPETLQGSRIYVDGQVEKIYGDEHSVAEVKIWKAMTPKGPTQVMRIAWADPLALIYGAGLLYQQAMDKNGNRLDGGQPFRTIANFEFRDGRPRYLPELVYLGYYDKEPLIPVSSCALKDGELVITPPATIQDE